MTKNTSLYITIDPNLVKKTWENFANKINGKYQYKELIRANINGPMHHNEIIARLDSFDLIIDQTIYIIPINNDHFSPLTYRLSKKTNQKKIFRIRERDFFDKILGLNKTNLSVNNEGKSFSFKTNIKYLEKLLNTDKELFNRLTSSKIKFSIETKNSTLEIQLKRFGVADNIKDLFNDLEILNKLVIQANL